METFATIVFWLIADPAGQALVLTLFAAWCVYALVDIITY